MMVFDSQGAESQVSCITWGGMTHLNRQGSIESPLKDSNQAGTSGRGGQSDLRRARGPKRKGKEGGSGQDADVNPSEGKKKCVKIWGGEFGCVKPDQGRPVDASFWHALAGSLRGVPSVGSKVVYFPQGHLEQLTAMAAIEAALRQYGEDGLDGGVVIDHPPPAITNEVRAPSQIICHVTEATLHAEPGTDELHARLTLQPEAEGGGASGEHGSAWPGGQNLQPKRMFYKLLTASDTNTHGGFSVPRKAAEDVFPEMDYKQTPPVQEIVAKDIHGNEWKFRHIYRGSPKRHLLTTGWSAFIGTKKLKEGDAIIFARTHDGVLRVGVRRAVDRPVASAVRCAYVSGQAVLEQAVAGAAYGQPIRVAYFPRTNVPDFVIPLAKFKHALEEPRCAGSRVELSCEEAFAPQTKLGTIAAVQDVDPRWWGGSLWRCCRVVQLASDFQAGPSTQPVAPPADQELGRFSPWELDLVPLEGLLKRTGKAPSKPSPQKRGSTAGGGNLGGVPSLVPNGGFNLVESEERFRGGLEGGVLLHLQQQPEAGSRWGVIMEPRNATPLSKDLPEALPVGELAVRPVEVVNQPVLGWGSGAPLLGGSSRQDGGEGIVVPGGGGLDRGGLLPAAATWHHVVPSESPGKECRLFGVSLTTPPLHSPHPQPVKLEDCPPQIGAPEGGGPQQGVGWLQPGQFFSYLQEVGSTPPKVPPRLTDVYRGGKKGGKLDLSTLGGYDELNWELARLLSLCDKSERYKFVYRDSEGDLLFVGDGQWQDFCNSARQIRVLSESEFGSTMRYPRLVA